MKRFLVMMIIFQWIGLMANGQWNGTIDTNNILNNVNLPSFIKELEKTKLVTKNDKKFIPVFIQRFLNFLIGSNNVTDSFAIANPGEWFNKFDFGRSAAYPDRQIQYLGIGENFFVMNYNYGGTMGGTYHTMIIKFRNNQIEDFWVGFSTKNTNKKAIISHLKRCSVRMKSNLLII
jgi:hypothetical protein